MGDGAFVLAEKVDGAGARVGVGRGDVREGFWGLLSDPADTEVACLLDEAVAFPLWQVGHDGGVEDDDGGVVGGRGDGFGEAFVEVALDEAGRIGCGDVDGGVEAGGAVVVFGPDEGA